MPFGSINVSLWWEKWKKFIFFILIFISKTSIWEGNGFFLKKKKIAFSLASIRSKGNQVKLPEPSLHMKFWGKHSPNFNTAGGIPGKSSLFFFTVISGWFFFLIKKKLAHPAYWVIPVFFGFFFFFFTFAYDINVYFVFLFLLSEFL